MRQTFGEADVDAIDAIIADVASSMPPGHEGCRGNIDDGGPLVYNITARTGLAMSAHLQFGEFGKPSSVPSMYFVDDRAYLDDDGRCHVDWGTFRRLVKEHAGMSLRLDSYGWRSHREIPQVPARNVGRVMDCFYGRCS